MKQSNLNVVYFPFWKMEARTLFTQVMAKAASGFFFFLGLAVDDGEGVVLMMGTLQDEGSSLTLFPSAQVPFLKKLVLLLPSVFVIHPKLE